MISTALLLSMIAQATPSFKCGERTTARKPYGKVVVKVDCIYWRNNLVTIDEYRGKTLHGYSLSFDSLGRKRSSRLYVNGKSHGEVIAWDTLGDTVSRYMMRNDVQVGKHVAAYSKGKPKFVKHYDNQGREHGTWDEWWPTGHKRKEAVHSHGQLKTSKEWYPSGKPWIQYAVHFRKLEEDLYARRVSSLKVWAPDGRPAGEIRGGRGQAITFILDEEKGFLVRGAVHEVYRDSVVVKVDALDTLQAYGRLDSLGRLGETGFEGSGR